MHWTLIHPIGFPIDGNIVSMPRTVLERIGERTTVRERWEVEFPRFQKTFGFKCRVESGKEVLLCHVFYYSGTGRNGNTLWKVFLECVGEKQQKNIVGKPVGKLCIRLWISCG